jgi:hypothetical protein
VTTGENFSGAIIRDHLSIVLLSSYSVNKKCARVEEAEAEACYEGIKQATKWIKKPTIIESDCLCLVEALKTPMEDRSRYSNIVKEIKHDTRRFSKIGRECNRVAHQLAQLARRTLHSAVWRENFPFCICELLKLECNKSVDE